VIIRTGLTIGRPLALLMAMRRPGLQRGGHVVHTGAKRTELVRSADVVGRRGRSSRSRDSRHGKPGAAVVGAGTSWSGKNS